MQKTPIEAGYGVGECRWQDQEVSDRPLVHMRACVWRTLANAMSENEWCMMRSTDDTADGDSVPSADVTHDCSSSIAS